MVDDYYDLTGAEQLNEYVRYLQRRYPDTLASDAVPIYWSVGGDGICETAPFQSYPFNSRDFLTEFTWPRDAITGEPLDWYRLAVVNDRFPEFAEALGWMPSQLQPTCPLLSILASRSGRAPKPRSITV